MDNFDPRLPAQESDAIEPLARQNGETGGADWRAAVVFPARFELGMLLITPGAICAFEEANQLPATFLVRHATGDWGVVDGHDWRENDLGLKNGFRVLSAYDLPGTGRRIWIITEADHSATTILLPDEY